MNIKYYLSSRTAPDDTAEVFVRFYSARECDQRTRTGIRVPVTAWDAKNCRVILPRRAFSSEVAVLSGKQKKLDALAGFLFARCSSSLGIIGDGWLRDAVAQFCGVTLNQTPLADYVQQYARAINLAPRSIMRYNAIAAHLRDFRPLFVQTTGAEDISAFEAFLYGRGLCQNSVSARLKGLRAVFNYAASHGMPTRSPFAAYKIPAEKYGSVVYLTKEECDKLADAVMPSPSLAVQRDIFIFQCHIGCRISDLYGLTRENITADGCVQYIQHKLRRENAHTIRVPLSPVARDILQRYANGKKILPFISEQKYNDAIKRCIIAAGVDRPIIVQDKKTLHQKSVMLSSVASSHLARRTFAELVFQHTGSERLVASMTGHSSHSSAICRYTEVSDEMKRAAISADILPT